jgi:hypothetical protein
MEKEAIMMKIALQMHRHYPMMNRELIVDICKTNLLG